MGRAAPAVVRHLRRFTVSIVLSAALLGFAPSSRSSHPLHTSLTELSHLPSGTLTIRVRAFAQDIDAVIGNTSRGTAITDSAVTVYLGRNLTLTDERGRAIALSPCGIRREGEAVFACMQAKSTSAPSTLTMRNELLFDLFDDQINVVQVISGSSRRSLLFTKRSRVKRLP